MNPSEENLEPDPAAYPRARNLWIRFVTPEEKATAEQIVAGLITRVFIREHPSFFRAWFQNEEKRAPATTIPLEPKAAPTAPPAQEPLLMQAKDAARFLGIAPSTWWRLISCGRLPPPVHLGSRPLWRRAELEAWVDAGCPPIDQWLLMQEDGKKFKGTRRRTS